MCGTVAIGLLGGLVASKLLFRARFRRHHHHPHHGGWGRWRRARFDAPPPPVVELDTQKALDKLLGPLELSQRQAEEAREAFADVAQALGTRWSNWSGLEEALNAVAAEPFDQARAQAAIGASEQAKLAVDALEHVHNILTPEQRDRLEQALLKWR